MVYYVEPIKLRKRHANKFKIAIAILIVIIVLSISIALGIFTVKKVRESKNNEILENVMEERKTEIDKQQEVVAQTQEQPEEKKENVVAQQVVKPEVDYKKFVANVNNIYDGKEGKRVFLTFDDGPSEAVTPYILDTLKKYNIKATFFVLGDRVKYNQDLIKREYNEGHYIANHGYTHDYGKIYSNYKKVLEEYNNTEKEIRKALGNKKYSSHLFRYPGGSVGGVYNKLKQKSKEQLKKNDIAYLDWNALTNDAAGANTKKKILQNLKETVGNKENVVLLMHDAPDKILTYETLEELIKYLQGKGYVFKNMYDLM